MGLVLFSVYIITGKNNRYKIQISEYKRIFYCMSIGGPDEAKAHARGQWGPYHRLFVVSRTLVKTLVCRFIINKFPFLSEVNRYQSLASIN